MHALLYVVCALSLTTVLSSGNPRNTPPPPPPNKRQGGDRQQRPQPRNNMNGKSMYKFDRNNNRPPNGDNDGMGGLNFDEFDEDFSRSPPPMPQSGRVDATKSGGPQRQRGPPAAASHGRPRPSKVRLV